MQKLSIRCALLFAMVLLASIALKAFYGKLNPLPYYYPSATIHFKTTYLKSHAGAINTLFAGSSRVMREIDPPIFDSLMDPALHIKSFNFGVNWLAASELLYFIDKLTGDSSLHLKFVFIELSKIKIADLKNLNTTRVTHWYNLQDYWFTVNSALHGNSTLPVKMASVAFNSVSFTSHMLNLGYFSVLNDFSKTKKETKSNMQNLNGDYSGFGGLDRFAVKNQVDRNPEENILLRTSRFLKDTSGLTMRKKWSENEFTKFENNPELLKKYNTVYLERLNHLTSTLVSKGIYPVYLITPRSEKEQYEELLPLFAQLPARHKIEICDSRRYPELYTVENSLDETHLNAKGAKILTTILADQFSKLLKDSIR